jgi:uncharacterized RDD family membrane protein YckC
MWYYTENGEQRGPVTDPDLAALVQAGKIDDETLVWREGMTEWQPYRTVKPSPAGSGPGGTSAPTAGEVACAECGRRFPAGEVIQYSGVNVCAGCKPVFFQKLREGVQVGGAVTMNYAGFWLRFAAYLLDGIITGVAGMIIGMVIGMAGALIGGARTPSNVGAMMAIQFSAMGLSLLFQLSYHAFFLGKFGATPGKMACGIKVVNGDGSPISYLKGAGRFLAYFVSSLTCLIGFLIMLGDDQKRTLHDRICDTRVIKK